MKTLILGGNWLCLTAEAGKGFAACAGTPARRVFAR
jgi:hypothetical protein